MAGKNFEKLAQTGKTAGDEDGVDGWKVGGKALG